MNKKMFREYDLTDLKNIRELSKKEQMIKNLEYVRSIMYDNNEYSNSLDSLIDYMIKYLEDESD